MKKIFRKPHQFKKKKSIIRNRFFWRGILIFVFIISLFYFLFLSKTFQVEMITVSGEEKVSTEGIKLLVEKKLENKILFFKTKSIFLVNLDEIKNDILNNFPQTAEVEIGRGFPDALNILVIERLSLVTWCQGENCFLLDNEGVIFEEAQPEEVLPKITDKQKISAVSPGEKVIEKENLNLILEIERKIKENLKIDVVEFIIVSEERLNVKTAEGWEIYLNFKEDINWQLTKLNLILEERIPPEKRRNVEYIDLRFEKVYIFPETYQSM